MKRARAGLYIALVAVLSLAAGCAMAPISPGRTPSALEPRGPAAGHIAQLWWVMFGLGAAIWLLVLVLMFAALLRRRRSNSATQPDSSGGDTGRRWVIWGGLALPLVVLAVVFGYSTYTLAAVQDRPAPIEIRVIGRRWWWEVHYPNQAVITANEIHLPVNTPATIRLESADVIHSFWVPELHGKMDLIPTRINYVTLQSNEIGVYRGECAEFCGLQHAHMGFMVVVEPVGDFNNWIATQQQQAAAPADPLAQQGQQLFLSAGCVYCHTVRGLDDKSVDRSGVDLGPDLTHFGSRLTIAGASVTKNTGNLGGWIADPQHIKPGALMPNQYLNSTDLQAVIAYLETLK